MSIPSISSLTFNFHATSILTTEKSALSRRIKCRKKLILQKSFFETPVVLKSFISNFQFGLRFITFYSHNNTEYSKFGNLSLVRVQAVFEPASVWSLGVYRVCHMCEKLCPMTP